MAVRNGSALQEFNISHTVANIGSHPENDIVLPGIRPFHAVILLENGQHRLVSLGADAPILMNGSLISATSIEVLEGQNFEIGGHILTVQRGGAPDSLYLLLSSVQPASPGLDVTIQSPTTVLMDGNESSILVNAFSNTMEIEVERTASYELEIINGGPIVANFALQVQGLPEDWVKISPGAVNLNEGQRARVRIQISAPRASTSTAGKHPFYFIVTSVNYPGQRSVTPLDLTILPFYEFILGSPNPRQQNIPWRKHQGTVHLPVTNLSNDTTPFTISALDEENGCTFDFCVTDSLQLTKQASFKAPPGDVIQLPVEITPLKQPMIALRSRRYHYTTTVQVAEQTAAPQMVSGTVVSHPLFGWWSILLAVLMVAVGLFLLVQPRITYFQVAAGKDVIEQGDTTTLEWKVSPFATRLSISGIEDTIKNGQTHLTVSPAQSTSYEIVAGNWLSSLVGLDQKRIQTVLVVPPSPGISVFEVDQTRVDKGKPVNIRWSVTQAEQAFLTIDEVVYELKADEFSGEKSVVLENDSVVTLEAQSGSGSELRSYFINVVPPHIDVLSFTVWTRPATTALNWTLPVAVRPGLGLSGTPGRTLAAPVLPGDIVLNPFLQDSDFSEKYVELILDSSSDTGYRVEFYQPSRELAKGEQVMLEWNVDGVDTLAIAPFTEVLPNHGKQPFFPQESMNFVMTAQSGDLEKLFMLPVTVFDGEPPKAPTIDIFNASPSKSVGATDVQFSWSISGEWTRVQLMAGPDIVADWLNPQGFKKINVGATTSFILTAWNGSLSNAKILEVTIDPSLEESTLLITDIYPPQGYFRVGDKVNVFIDFKDLPEDTPDPTGDIIVSDGFSICKIELPIKSCVLTFVRPGTKEIKASYLGDDIYASTDSKVYTKEKIIVDANRVSLTPAYYYTSLGAKAASIPVIANADLRVGDGLLIDVTVTAQNRTLEDDKKSQVTVRYCPVNASNKIIESECISAGPSTVTLSTVGGTVIGHAEILIANLRKKGNFALLISYVHLDGSFEPVLIGSTSADRIAFSVKKGDLVLVPQSTSPCNYKTCLLHQSASATIVFDARLLLDDMSTIDPADDEMVDLFPNFPAPGPLSIIATPGSGIPSDWSGSCVWQVNGSIYQLYCTAIDLSDAVNLSYNFSPADPNYTTPFPLPITIEVKKAANIDISSTVLTGLHVGQRVDLQKGAILVKEVITGDYVNGAIINVTAKDTGNDIHTMIKIVTGSNCAWAADSTKGLQLTQTATPATDSCVVYFNHVGINDLSFSFEGTSTHDVDSETRDVSIGKQSGLTLTWSPAFPANLAIFTDQNESLTVQCDASSPSCANFSPIVLTGAAIIFDMSQAVGCQVYQNNGLLSDGKTNLPATLTGGLMTLDGIRFRCSNQGNKTIRVDFIDPSYADFAFKANGGNTPIVKIGNRSASISPEFRIYDDFSQTTSTMVGSPTTAIPNLYVAEAYQVLVTVTNVAEEDTTSADDYIKMTWPVALDGRLDTDSAKTTCVKSSTNGEFHIPLTKKTGPTRWEASCKINFKYETATNLGTTDKITYELVTKDSRYNSTSQQIDLPNSVVKRAITISSSLIANTMDANGNPYARTTPKLVISISDGHNQLDAITDWANYLTVTPSYGTTAVTCIKAGSNIECPIRDTEVWSGNVAVQYSGNPSFAANTLTPAPSVSIVAIPINMTTTTGTFPEHFACITEDCKTHGTWPGQNGIDYSWKNKVYQLDFTLSPLITTTLAGNVTVVFNGWTNNCNVIDFQNSTATRSGCTFYIPINTTTNIAHFEFKITSTNDSASYTVNYEPGTAPLSAGTGWGTTKNFHAYNQVSFTLEVDNSGDSDGVQLTSPTTFFTFYAEYINTGPNCTETQVVFLCEDTTHCWGNYGFYNPDEDSPDHDEKIDTEPDWDDMISGGCTYQVAIKNGTDVGFKSYP